MFRTPHASGTRLASLGLLLAVSAALALPARADVTIQEKTVSSGIGGFGGGTSTTTRVIAGDKARDDQTYTYTGRLKTFAGKPRSTTSITRLDKELIWELDNAKKAYSEMTFAEMREAMTRGAEEAKAEMAKEKAKGQQDVQVDFKVDVQRPGKKESVNGFDAEEWIITLTATPKDKKSGESAGSYKIKLDGWYSTQVPGQSEVTAYYRRWAEKMGMDPQLKSMATGMLAAHPDAVREIAAKMKDLKGVAVRSTMTMDLGVGGTPEQQAKLDKARADAAAAQAEEKAKQEAADDNSAKSSALGSLAKGNVGGALGGFMHRKASKAAEKKVEDSVTPDAGSGSGSGAAFTVTTDMVSVSTGSAGASFDVPAGYKKLERETEKK